MDEEESWRLAVSLAAPHAFGGDEQTRLRLWEESAGHPALVAALATSPGAVESLTADEARMRPETARVVIHRLLDQEVPATVAALELAAVAVESAPSATFPRQALLASSPRLDALPPGDLVDGIRRGAAAGLLEPAAGEEADTFRFRHRALARALLVLAPAERLSRLHSALAFGFEAVSAQRVQGLVRVARHLDRAWPTVAAPDAVRWLNGAAQRCLDLDEPVAARDLVDTALAFAVRDGCVSPAARAESLLLRRWAVRAQPDRLEAQRTVARFALDNRLAGVLAVAAVDLFGPLRPEGWSDGHPDVGLLRAAAAMDHPDPAVGAEVVAVLSVVDRDSRDQATSAIGAARRAGDTVALGARLRSWWAHAPVADRGGLAEELAQVAEATCDAGLRAEADLCRWVTAASEGGCRFDEVPPQLSLGVRRAGDQSLTWRYRVWKATLAIARGSTDAAAQIDAARQVRLDRLEPGAAVRANPALRDDVHQVQRTLYAMMRLGEATEEGAGAGIPTFSASHAERYQRAVVAAFSGLPSAASQLDDLLDEGVAAGPQNSEWIATMVLLGHAASMVRHPEAMELCLELLAPHRRRHAFGGLTRYHGPVAGAVAALHLGQGDAASALDAYGACFDLADRAGAEMWKAWAQLGMAHAHRRRGRPDDHHQARRLAREGGRCAPALGFPSAPLLID